MRVYDGSRGCCRNGQPPLESTRKNRHKPIKPFKGKATTTCARTPGPGKQRGLLLLFFEFADNRPPRLVQNTHSTVRKAEKGFRSLGASESASRRNGQGGQRMCQRPLRAPMCRTLFCRRIRERIWLGKGPVALLVGFFWPGNTLTYINPVRRNGGRLIGLCNGIV